MKIFATENTEDTDMKDDNGSELKTMGLLQAEASEAVVPLDRPGTDLNTAACDAAAAGNPNNRKCGGCGRAFYGESAFCGGKRCRKNDLETGFKPWDGPQLLPGGRKFVRGMDR